MQKSNSSGLNQDTVKARISTIYLSRTGLLEPLGQSQVLAYLRYLSNSFQITLVTYEKDSDWSDIERRNKLLEECRGFNITWKPKRFHAKPRLLGSFLDSVDMLFFVLLSVWRQPIMLIHARSYIPTFVAIWATVLKRVPLIFDMRGFWIDELVVSGRLSRGSLGYLAMRGVERACLRRASAIVTLTDVAADYLRKLYPEEVYEKPIVVIPTCADLDRFVPAARQDTKFILGCLGTVLSGWFRADWLSAFFILAAKRNPYVSFHVTTRDDPYKVREVIGGGEDLQARLTVLACSPESVHRVIQGQAASVMFYAGSDVSEMGRSPTRFAEILGCGLPVVTNQGVGDLAKIVGKYRVGVLINDPSQGELNAAWDDLMNLLGDPELGNRCRSVAENLFSLKAGAATYTTLYNHLSPSQPTGLMPHQ